MIKNELQQTEIISETDSCIAPSPQLEPISAVSPESASEQQPGATVASGNTDTRADQPVDHSDNGPPTNNAAKGPSPTEESVDAGSLHPAVRHGDIKFTTFQGSPGAVLTKELSLDRDNNVNTNSTPLFIEGTARTESITRLTDLEQITQVLGPNECITTGIFDRSPCEIALKADLTQDQIAAGVRARSLDFMSQPSPGLVLLDYDPSPRMPEHMHCGSPTDLMDKLARLSPLLEGIGYSGAGSTSNGIINIKTGEPHIKNGFHCYILTTETDLRVLRKWLRVKCWLAGYGYIDFGRNGVMLARCLVDITVLSPERLIYEAPPVLGEGLGRADREWTHQAGGLLTGDFSVSSANIKACRQAVAAAKSDPATKGESIRLHAHYYDLKSRERAKVKSITVEEAKRQRPRREPPKGIAEEITLYRDDTVYVKGEIMSVEQLVAQGEAHDRTPVPDPVEGPDYGSATAMFFYNDGIHPVIHSFAHGQQICYSIKSHTRLTGIEAVQCLDPAGFPHTVEVKGKLVPAATIPNLRHMLDRYEIGVYYNVIGKRLDIRIPGLQGSPDNIDNSALSQIVSLSSQNQMKIGQVSNYIAAIADQAQYNPVTEWVCSKPWDGTDRLTDFYATLTTEGSFPEDMKQILMFRWLISAIAAAFLPSGFHARGVLVLQGAQSMGKTSWVKNLISDPFLRETVIKVDHHLDASNRDSIVLAISHWIVELGELESTMKRDIPRLKGFITSDADKLRLSYARRESSYQRRSIFCATVNREDFLVDDTGNSRWWTLPVTAINYDHDIDMQQLWAQVYHIYETDKPNWWLSRREEGQLEALNRNHRATSTIRQLIEARIDFNYKEHWRTCSVVNATTILQALGKQNPSSTEAKECAAVMREHLGQATRSNGVTGWRINLPDHG